MQVTELASLQEDAGMLHVKKVDFVICMAMVINGTAKV
jgi:hypothetical protein